MRISTPNPIVVSKHATERFQQRIAQVPKREAEKILREAARKAPIYRRGRQHTTAMYNDRCFVMVMVHSNVITVY